MLFKCYLFDKAFYYQHYYKGKTGKLRFFFQHISAIDTPRLAVYFFKHALSRERKLYEKNKNFRDCCYYSPIDGEKDVTFKIIQNDQAVETLDSLMTTQQFR